MEAEVTEEVEVAVEIKVEVEVKLEVEVIFEVEVEIEAIGLRCQQNSCERSQKPSLVPNREYKKRESSGMQSPNIPSAR